VQQATLGAEGNSRSRPGSAQRGAPAGVAQHGPLVDSSHVDAGAVPCCCGVLSSTPAWPQVMLRRVAIDADQRRLHAIECTVQMGTGTASAVLAASQVYAALYFAAGQQQGALQVQDDDEDTTFDLPDSIKLGLGGEAGTCRNHTLP